MMLCLHICILYNAKTIYIYCIVCRERIKMTSAATDQRYIFGITGTVKEIIYPSKAILAFKYSGKEEKAILLVHKYLLDGVAVDEHKLMSDVLKIGDVLEFDGHIYDKGGYGGGKDRCNYYAMRAWKASQSKIVSKEQMQTSKSGRPAVIVGTGFISEVFPRNTNHFLNKKSQNYTICIYLTDIIK